MLLNRETFGFQARAVANCLATIFLVGMISEVENFKERRPLLRGRATPGREG